MKLRSIPFRAMLAAGLVFAVIPTYALGRNSSADQQNNGNSLPYPGKVVEQIVARVDDQVIDTSDYKRAEKELKQEAQHQGWTPQQLATQKKNLLRNLIDKQLLLAKGKQLGISGEDELIHRLDEIRKQNHLKSMQALRQAVESQGLSWQDFKQQIRQRIIQSEVIRQKVTPNIRISPLEVQQYYDKHKSEFKRPEAVRLSEILIATPHPDNAAEVAKAKAKAESIEKQLKSGAKFAALAKKDSSGPMAKQGGDLGMFQRGQLAPELEKDTFSLKAGQHTQPIQTRQGWIILKVTKHQSAGVAPLSAVQNQIMNTIGYSKMQPALRKYLTKLREEAYIDIRPGYTDTGATPNEVKPMYTAYKPPTDRKKKKRDFRRVRYEVRRGRRHKKKHERARKAGTEKPGKREKIRYGQAPREALPPAMNQTDLNNASGQSANNAMAGAAQANQQSNYKKPKKVRYTTMMMRKRRKEQKEKAREAARKARLEKKEKSKPAVTPVSKATLQEQETSLGLGGVTKKKKAHPMRKGPKRRYTNVQEKKRQEQQKEKKAAGTSSGSSSTGSGS